MAARRVERLQGLKQELEKAYPSVTVTAVQLDVRNKKEIDEVVAQSPPVDILVNNAGMVLGMDPLEKVDETEFDQMIATNVKGLVFLTQAVIPTMRERQAGHIINLGSIAGKQAYANGSIYCGRNTLKGLSSQRLSDVVD